MNDFSERINEILNHGALNLAMAIGYKNQIFDILEDLNKPVTVLEIASASGLNDRYLKEWLGIMVTGKIIEILPSIPNISNGIGLKIINLLFLLYRFYYFFQD